MDITDVRIRTMDNGGRMKAVASVTFDDEFGARHQGVEGKGIFVAIPASEWGIRSKM